jgi:hypothetical protein
MPKRVKSSFRIIKSHNNPAGARTMGGSAFKSVTVKKNKPQKKGFK